MRKSKKRRSSNTRNQTITEQYDLAISFAGNDREMAREIATKMTARGYNVFFDEYEKARLWGADLSSELGRIYMEASRYCLILVSQKYAEKAWTNHERQFAIARALQERRPYILAVVLDGTRLEGLSPTVGYLDIRNSSLEEVCRLLYAKLGDPQERKQESSGKLTTNAVAAIRDVLAACYRRAIFTRFSLQFGQKEMFKSLSEIRPSLQRLIMYVEPLENRRLVAGIIGELDFIEAVNAPERDTLDKARWEDRLPSAEKEEDEGAKALSRAIGRCRIIDGAKLRIISSLSALAKSAELPLALPPSVVRDGFSSEEDRFFSEEEANEADRLLKGNCEAWKL